jgi:hypothetical protein
MAWVVTPAKAGVHVSTEGSRFPLRGNDEHWVVFERGRALHLFHLTAWVFNPARAGWVSRPEDRSRPAGSSYNEYAGISAEEQNERRGLIVDRVRMPADPRTRI